MVVYMGMYLHFCQVHGKAIDWSPWQPPVEPPAAPPVRERERAREPEPAGVT